MNNILLDSIMLKNKNIQNYINSENQKVFYWYATSFSRWSLYTHYIQMDKTSWTYRSGVYIGHFDLPVPPPQPSKSISPPALRRAGRNSPLFRVYNPKRCDFIFEAFYLILMQFSPFFPSPSFFFPPVPSFPFSLQPSNPPRPPNGQDNSICIIYTPGKLSLS